MRRGLVTSESVGPGHPDKICDQISDAILDAYLAKDPDSRVAVNVSIKNDRMFVFGEVTSKAEIVYQEVIDTVLKSIGVNTIYVVDRHVSRQSPDIAQGVDTGGAGDQGMVVGYATDETETMMPLAIHMAHGIMMEIDRGRRDGTLRWAGPDMKCQVTVDYGTANNAWNAGRCPVRAVVVSVQHSEDYEPETFRRMIEHLVKKSLYSMNYSFYPKYDLYINNTGKFVVGGSFGDSGLTGRKIVVDTYGGVVPHGGGAFSGKDCTKMDRSAAYAARWVAKKVVSLKMAKECEVHISYAIGKAEPVAVMVDSHGTGDDRAIERFIAENYPLTPKWIRDFFDLRRPIYGKTAVFGHFGRRDIELPWEDVKIDKK